MARLAYQRRQQLPKSQFAIPAQSPRAGSYPIDTANRARNALARVAQHGSPTEKAKVRAAVARRYPEIQQRSTRGSPPMTAAELNRGYRALGRAPLGG